MHAEYFHLSGQTIEALREATAKGRRIIAVGTTTVRALETLATAVCGQELSCGWQEGYSGWTRLFILPGFQFRVVDGLITNFHLPRSTLLMRVSAFVGRERVLAAYREAIHHRYRFFSFGDATLMWRPGSSYDGQG